MTSVSMSNSIYLSVEALRTSEEVGGWDNIHKMGLAVGVTYCPQTCRLRIFEEDQAAELVRLLNAADLVVGHNCRRFDLTVLKAYGPIKVKPSRCLDLLVEFQKAKGHLIVLESLLSGTLGLQGLPDATQRRLWIKTGQTTRAVEACCQTVLGLERLHRYALRNEGVYFRDRFGKRVRARLDLNSFGKR
jgi:DEAD/DEAH box helicase domain-containing protein